MTLSRAIDLFLDWRHVERGASPRSNESYRDHLYKLAARHPDARLEDFTGSLGTPLLREYLAARIQECREKRGRELSAATRCNIISVLHSFFGWAESEDLIEVDPSRKIHRPPKRKPPIIGRLCGSRQVPRRREPVRAATDSSWRASVFATARSLFCRWQDIDLVNGHVQVHRKGSNWQWVPVAPDVLRELRRCFRLIEPDLDDHVFTVEVEQWVSTSERERQRLSQKAQVVQALGRMVKRDLQASGNRGVCPTRSGTAWETGSFAKATRI